MWGQLLETGTTVVAFSRLEGGSWSDTEFLSQGAGTDPVVTTDSDGNVIVAWSADTEIIVQRWKNGRWGSPEKIGQGSTPMLAPGDPVTIAWTRPVGTGFELVITGLPEGGTNSTVPIFIGAAAVSLACSSP